MEPDYTKRELDEKFENLSTLVREKHDDAMIKIGEVIVQTTRTNGRVSWLEKMLYLAMGFCSCITILILPVLFILIENAKSL